MWLKKYLIIKKLAKNYIYLLVCGQTFSDFYDFMILKVEKEVER